MKKLFRFKYEPCNGTCYAYQPIFIKELSRVSKDNIFKLINTTKAKAKVSKIVL